MTPRYANYVQPFSLFSLVACIPQYSRGSGDKATLSETEDRGIEPLTSFLDVSILIILIKIVNTSVYVVVVRGHCDKTASVVVKQNC